MKEMPIFQSPEKKCDVFMTSNYSQFFITVLCFLGENEKKLLTHTRRKKKEKKMKYSYVPLSTLFFRRESDRLEFLPWNM